MKLQNVDFTAKLSRWVAAGLLLILGAVSANAQVAFDTIDWTMDRGNLVFTAGNNGVPFRQGLNDFTISDPIGAPSAISPLNNDPGHAVRRWVFPRTSDISITSPNQNFSEAIDNPNTLDPLNFLDTSGNQTRVQPPPTGVAPYNPQLMAHAYQFGAWNSPNVVPGAPNDYRSPSGGFSFTNDPSKVYDHDYAYTNAVHNDFLVDRGGGKLTPATDGEMTALPAGPPEVYSAVQNILNGTVTATAVWTAGGYNIPAGRYSVDIYSPADGTVIANVAHPNATRALVRVSIGHTHNALDPLDPPDLNTVDAFGNIIKAGVENPIYSRIFVVDISAGGWLPIAPGGQNPSAFIYDGNPNHQIVVTLYTLTPNNINDTTIFQTKPVITADACRFNSVLQPTSIGLQQTVARSPNNPFTISATGRILGPVLGTNKFRNAPYNLLDAEPLIYFAREESVPNPNPTVARDPSLPVQTDPAQPNYNPLVPDPTQLVSAPVFYCIDNRNGNALVGGFTIASIDKVRWRYVGAPDSFNGSGTATASPFMANVRCRDGVIRPIIYFVTTNAAGNIGHIYALDPVGDRSNLPGTVDYRSTTAYWTYPSYRPLTPAEKITGQLPDQYHDPNYVGAVDYNGTPLRPALGVGPYGGLSPWGDDFGALEKRYVDGDIIANPAVANHFVVKTDTHITFGGIQSSPMVIDDPGNQGGAQILVVGNMNGRMYTFDAGGRGDFTYDKTDPNNIAVSLAGTTQRYWTWPHLGADAYHAAGKTGTNVVQDEASKVAFPSSPAYDPTYPALGLDPNRKPIFIGAADGHMFALSPSHDTFSGISNQNKPIFNERRIWVYPNNPNSKTDTQSLNAAPSTVSIFQPAGIAAPLIYFTCGGRVYTINESYPINPNGTPTFVNNTNFRSVFPATNNPPFANPADSNSAPLDPGFSGSAPLLVDQAKLGTAKDVCYVVNGAGSVIALDAASVGGGVVIASGETLGGATRCTPIASMLISITGLASGTPNFETTKSHPCIVFADDSGTIWGVSAITDTSAPGNPVGPIGNTPLLPLVWAHFDSSQSRLGSASLANGMLVEGGDDGQLRAYSIGTGLNGLGDTLGPGEPAETGFGAGEVSIDIRNVNLFSSIDYPTFGTTSGTPAHTGPAGGYTNSKAFIPGTINPANGTPNVEWPVAYDWGDRIYIAAAGVYHAQPQDGALSRGNGPPVINVTFEISEPGQPNVTMVKTVTPTTTGPHTSGATWPDDIGITVIEHNGVSIYGIDANNVDPMSMALVNPFGEKLTGPAQNVFPYEAHIALPIQPDATHRFLPGNAGYRIRVYAEISQSINDNGTTTAQTRRSDTLNIGQNDYKGLRPVDDTMPPSATNPVAPTSPNRQDILGRRREIFITNPLGVTVRSFNTLNGYNGEIGTQDMTTNSPNVVGFGGSATNISLVGNIFEVLGNGNRINNPYAQTANNPVKGLYAPAGMINDGASQVYSGIDNGGNKKSAFYVTDRSNLSQLTRRGGLNFEAFVKPLRWLGGPSSVMNPLPWEDQPNDAQESRDYPNIAQDKVTLVNQRDGFDISRSVGSLNPPSYDPGKNANDAAIFRIPVPTEVRMTISVPRFQPANVNSGITSVTKADGTTLNIGSSYTDIGGNVFGNGAARITGPVNVVTGKPVGLGTPFTFPAGGYVSEIVVRVILPGTAGNAAAAVRFNPQAIFDDSRGDATAPLRDTYRSTEMGITVPPNTKMRVIEQTIDLGKLPHGTGYSDHPNGSTAFRLPFSPTGSADYLGITSPWDDDNDPFGDIAQNPFPIGTFFRPFTLISESNINLYDLRIAKRLGSVANFVNSTIVSDQTNTGIFGSPFTSLYGGNIGIISSFDHISKGILGEHSLWPLPNPYVDGAGIAAAFEGGLQTTDAPAFGLLKWDVGVQPNPTLHKPRVGDTTGTIASIPDIPYDAAAIKDVSGNIIFFTRVPRISMAIPLGTPVGTYQTPIYPFEDNTPLQWQEWLTASNGFAFGLSHDGILNTYVNGGVSTPIENHADPTFSVKATVREARLTSDATRGTLSQIDPLGQLRNAGNLDLLGANLLPAIAFKQVNNNVSGFALYWATNRQPVNSPYLQTSLANNTITFPKADSPWSMAYSYLSGGSEGFQFAANGTNTNLDGFWWRPFDTTSLFPGYNGAGQPNLLPDLFPATVAESTLKNVPYLPGVRAPRTARYASPAIAVGENFTHFVFWQGSVDKYRQTGANSQSTQITESRTFYAQVVGLPANGPAPADIMSILNDPALTKLSPKPTFFRLINNTPLLYLFWHAGNGSQTALYYNVNSTAGFPQTTWTQDIKLPTPSALVWQSDPTPIHHRVTDPITGNPVDVIDLVYTGVLKGRRSVETLMTRYQINPDGSLKVMPLPRVIQETMARDGATNTYTARDSAWAYGSGDNGIIVPNDKTGMIGIHIIKNGVGNPVQMNTFLDNTNTLQTQLGKYDPASGLVFFDNKILGGQIVVDIRSGSISFPQVAPGRNDVVLIDYVPQVMRLNASRDDSNIIRSNNLGNGFGNFASNDPAFRPRPAVTSPGNNTNPVALLDNFVNPRTGLVAPKVLSANNSSTDRLWVLYRKSDNVGGARSTIYYKALRLMVRLPRGVALTQPNANGDQQVSQVIVTGNLGPYEIDWVRGRIYFTTLDEGSIVTVNYRWADSSTGQSGISGNLNYRVAWGDEISATGLPPNPGQPKIDETTAEVVLPTDQAANEGQVTAFLTPPPFASQTLESDPKLWVFWTSSRSGSTDLYYEAISPKLYPTAINQR